MVFEVKNGSFEARKNWQSERQKERNVDRELLVFRKIKQLEEGRVEEGSFGHSEALSRQGKTLVEASLGLERVEAAGSGFFNVF